MHTKSSAPFKKALRFLTLSLATAGLVAMAPAAQANTSAAGGDAQSTRSIRSVADPICEQVQALEAHRLPNTKATTCTAEETFTVSSKMRLTPAQAIAQGDPMTPTGERLSVAAAARTVYYQNWTQDRRGLYYVNWYEKHQGLYYFDGIYAWVSPRYGWDAHGYHQCDLGYGILYDVQVKECSVRGNVTSAVIARDTFRVHVVWRGIPLYTTHTMDARLPAGGL